MIAGPIAAITVDAIIGIVAVVVWLIVQGASKRGGANSPRPPQPPSPDGTDPADPQDDLRRFFAELEKGLAGQTEPPPLTPPVLPQSPPPLSPVRQQAMTEADRHGKRVVANRPAPAAKPHSPPNKRQQASTSRVTPPGPPSPDFSWDHGFPVTVSPVTALKITDSNKEGDDHRQPSPRHSRRDLRRMIVGAEVLGKPVSLRRLSQPVI